MSNYEEKNEELEEVEESQDVLKDMVKNLNELPTDVLEQLLKNLNDIEEYNKAHPEEINGDDKK